MSYMKTCLPEPDNSGEEMYERTHEVLSYLHEVLPAEDFSLMCFHCGFSVEDFDHEAD